MFATEVIQRQAPTIQKAQSTVVVNESQVVDKVHAPVVLHRQAPMTQVVQATVGDRKRQREERVHGRSSTCVASWRTRMLEQAG